MSKKICQRIKCQFDEVGEQGCTNHRQSRRHGRGEALQRNTSLHTFSIGASGGLRFIEAGNINHHQCSQNKTTQNQMPWVPAIAHGDDANGHDDLWR